MIKETKSGVETLSVEFVLTPAWVGYAQWLVLLLGHLPEVLQVKSLSRPWEVEKGGFGQGLGGTGGLRGEIQACKSCSRSFSQHDPVNE
jgi:hypothetical protein